MLYGNMKESKTNSIIKIKDVESNAFKCILNFAYCKNPDITVYNLLSIKHICRKYQIDKLTAICDKQFKYFTTFSKYLFDIMIWIVEHKNFLKSKIQS